MLSIAFIAYVPGKVCVAIGLTHRLALIAWLLLVLAFGAQSLNEL
jgi:hypothetical protein